MSTITRRVLGPFNRVEGDLEVHVDVLDERIASARVNAPLFRGFEQMLLGKDPLDAMVYTPRICGICSVSQSVAAASALAGAQGIVATNNGQLATNLILATENLADHLTHFYLFFMPDFAREIYAQRTWYTSIEQRFRAQTGKAASEVLPARAQLLHLTGMLAGKWPHSLAIRPGGTTRPVEAAEKTRVATTIAVFRQFLQTTLFDDQLEHVAALSCRDELQQWQQAHPNSDFARFLMLCDELNLHDLGRASDVFMSYGAYQHGDNTLFLQGIWQEQLRQLDTAAISEDISHSWLASDVISAHPFAGSTTPDLSANPDNAYSWCKAPRLNKQAVEVGALARQMVNGHPLVRDMVSGQGGNVATRVIARLLELALVVPAMEDWCAQLIPRETFCTTGETPDEAKGVGLVEAARGSLGHWLVIRDKRIHNYQIIAPTTWNFSPNDADKQPGVLEQALQDTLVGSDEQASANIQHIIRSFDPCMVCTVH